MPDTLTLHEITIECHLGVEEWERVIPQPVWIDLELSIDAAKAAKRDDMRNAVDYARVISVVSEVARQGSFKLIETLAEQIAARLLFEFAQAVPRLTVRVMKKALPGLGYAEVEIERLARPANARPRWRSSVDAESGRDRTGRTRRRRAGVSTG